LAGGCVAGFEVVVLFDCMVLIDLFFGVTGYLAFVVGDSGDGGVLVETDPVGNVVVEF
jgi:hypothetical protein